MPDTEAGSALSGDIAMIAGAPEGVDARFLAERAAAGQDVLHVARDDARLYRLYELACFFAPDVPVFQLPACDCLPFDRAPPNREIVATRAATLAALAQNPSAGGRVVLTTVSAALQRVPPPQTFADAAFTIAVGDVVPPETLTTFLAGQGYRRAGTVREPGEFAIRGGIVDIFPPSEEWAVRIDLFGDTVDAARRFDPATQTSVGAVERIDLRPVSELVLTEDKITRFREAYRAAFPEGYAKDPLYEAISAGQGYPGHEHWLPFFYESMATVFDYLPGAAVTLDHQADEATSARLDQIDDYYDARRSFAAANREAARRGEFVYRPVPPELMFLDAEGWRAMLAAHGATSFTPFTAAEGMPGVLDLGGRRGRDYADARADPDVNVLDAVIDDAKSASRNGLKVVVTGHTAGSRERIRHLLADHGFETARMVEDWPSVNDGSGYGVALALLPLDRGFRTADALFVSEQDIFGDRLVRRRRPSRRSEAFIAELSSLSPGDFVVHADHGIGRYEGLESVTVTGAAHDCLRISYDGGDILFLPVENMDLLSRYGSEEGGAQPDRLGGAAWQARKAKVKDRIKDMADKLIAIAAERALHKSDVIAAERSAMDEFAARFPYAETDDQDRAIAEVLADLESGKAMDRLVCGDVGFGKTEIALRAAFAAVSAGLQVAVVVPTTLLARQHFATFSERFAGFPITLGQLSRLVSAREAGETRAGLADGSIDIVVGTHALFGKSVKFKKLGLIIVDEEQHFGVAQKERLKELRADVHVLTLTATPIPRTLQLALAGVRDMSLIATPPVDRLAVRTFVLPYDPVVIREAIHRELFRGGQVFYVCPRIEDLAAVAEQVRELAPDASVATAHGQMTPAELEAVMARFYSGELRILVSTNIIESGLDIPSVNTIIVHRADRFGLAQLYQLRGRVGRAKTRAYAYLTLPENQPISETALRRLEVMQTLDTLGAGFTLASHDMDIRGAGNLLGEEQSGHIKEVGIELYQHMLEEAVAAARTRDTGADTGEAAETWSPQISVGTAVLIPEDYVPDLSARLGLYRRLADLVDPADIDAFAAELADRFGPPPEEVNNLIEIIAIKQLCLGAHVARIDAGPKGAVLAFHDDHFPSPEGLVQFVAQQAGTVSLRPDHRLVYRRDWSDQRARVKGVRLLLTQLADIVASASG